jgi:hypothetical protein
VFNGERVEPENAQKNHLDNHFWRKLIKGGGVVCASRPFFYGSDTSLDFGHMLVFACNVQHRFKVRGDHFTEAFEFGVLLDPCDFETTLKVGAIYFC